MSNHITSSAADIPDLEAMPREARQALVFGLMAQNVPLIAQVNASQEEKRISEERHSKIIDLSARITEQSLLSQQNNDLKIANEELKTENEELNKLNAQMKLEIQKTICHKQVT